MCRDISTFYEYFNRETIKILEVYCIDYDFGDTTTVIAENIRSFVDEKYSIWLKEELESEFLLFRSSRHCSISAYISRRLYHLLNDTYSSYIQKKSILCLFINISLMKNLALKIESEIKSRPHLMYPERIAKRANWNMVLPAYAVTHSFLAENFFFVRYNKERIHGWQIFEIKDNLKNLNEIFYPTSPCSCFLVDIFFGSTYFLVIYSQKRFL